MWDNGGVVWEAKILNFGRENSKVHLRFISRWPSQYIVPSLNIIKNSESDCHAQIFYITGLGHHIYQKSGTDCENLALFTAAQKQIFFSVKLNCISRYFCLHYLHIYYCMEGKKLVKFNFTNFFCILGRLVPDYLGDFFFASKEVGTIG